MEAINKLRNEMKQLENDKSACRIALYLIGRCGESESLCQDVLDDKKTLHGCMDYVKNKARAQAVNGCACIEDETVFEWAEDYYHEEIKVAPEPKQTVTKAPKKKSAPKEKPALIKAINEVCGNRSEDNINGQISMF